MHWLFILTLKSILSSIIGSSFYQWFKNTKMGVWFQLKMDNLMQWVAKRYDIEIHCLDSQLKSKLSSFLMYLFKKLKRIWQDLKEMKQNLFSHM